MKIRTILWASILLLVSVQVNAALLSRLGGLAYYDDVADLTWLTDANYSQTSGYDADGIMSWDDGNAWAVSLNINGVTGWRLPKTEPIDGITSNDRNDSHIGTEDRGYSISAPGSLYEGTTASEIAYLFYNTLGNFAVCDLSASTVSTCSRTQGSYGYTNTGPFSDINTDFYWTETTFVPQVDSAWYFNFGTGY